MEIKPEWIKIHKALHSCKDTNKGVIIDFQVYPIQIHHNGCRCIRYDGILWIVQNQNKNSEYATRARAGEKITWGMRSPEPWIRIDDNVIKQYEQQNNLDHAQGGSGVHREMHPAPVQRANSA